MLQGLRLFGLYLPLFIWTRPRRGSSFYDAVLGKMKSKSTGYRFEGGTCLGVVACGPALLLLLSVLLVIFFLFWFSVVMMDEVTKFLT